MRFYYDEILENFRDNQKYLSDLEIVKRYGYKQINNIKAIIVIGNGEASAMFVQEVYPGIKREQALENIEECEVNYYCGGSILKAGFEYKGKVYYLNDFEKRVKK